MSGIPLPQMPTDNFHKFKAIGGIALIIAGVWVVCYVIFTGITMYLDVQGKIDNQVLEIYKRYDSAQDAWKLFKAEKEHEQLIPSNTAITLALIGLVLLAIVVGGIIMICCGRRLAVDGVMKWKKTQQTQDNILEHQLIKERTQQAERELRAYDEIWQKLIVVRKIVFNALFNHFPENSMQVVQELQKALVGLELAEGNQRPFVPKEIGEEFKSFFLQSKACGHYILENKPDEKSRGVMFTQNRDLYDKVAETIRKRITELTT